MPVLARKSWSKVFNQAAWKPGHATDTSFVRSNPVRPRTGLDFSWPIGPFDIVLHYILLSAFPPEMFRLDATTIAKRRPPDAELVRAAGLLLELDRDLAETFLVPAV